MEWWELLIVLVIVMPIAVLWLGCIIDMISRPDLAGWKKALWIVAILVFPLVGALAYVITRPTYGPLARSISFDGSGAYSTVEERFPGATTRSDGI